MEIKNHVVVNAPWVKTEKQGGALDPEIIVMHYTAGYTSEGDIQTLARDSVRASAHGVLSREGEWTQIVPFNRVAWHAGPSKYLFYNGLNAYSIGIEISNAGWIRRNRDTGGFTDQYGNRITIGGQFNSGRPLPTHISRWEEHKHKRLATGDYVWEPFAEKQLDALDTLVNALVKKYPKIKHVVSHEEIDTRGWKTDPGPMFPMDRYKKLVEGEKTDSVSTYIAYVKASKLNLRGGPGMTFQVIDELKYGDPVSVSEIDGDWAFVNDRGWVAHRYLER